MTRHAPGPRLHRGAYAPLFDRLEDEAPHEGQELRPHRVLTELELRQSVYREINRLLNSRAALTHAALDARGVRSVTDYGIPDLVSRSARDSHHRQQLTADIKTALEAYEPRLRDVDVRLDLGAESHNSLLVTVSGNLFADDVREAVSFRFAQSSGAWSQKPDADG